jgi:hypothetical protein
MRGMRTVGRNEVRRALAALACAAALVGCQAQGSPGAGEGSTARVSSAEASIPQAEWKIAVHPSGNSGKLGKLRAKRIRAQRPATRELIRRVYDGVFLAPAARRKDVLKSYFAGRAAAEFANTAGVPEGATEVTTTVRKADVGIDAAGAQRAAAVVVVRAHGRLGARSFGLLHRATLWLERSKGSWGVIAFDVRQRPIK